HAHRAADEQLWRALEERRAGPDRVPEGHQSAAAVAVGARSGHDRPGRRRRRRRSQGCAERRQSHGAPARADCPDEHSAQVAPSRSGPISFSLEPAATVASQTVAAGSGLNAPCPHLISRTTTMQVALSLLLVSVVPAQDAPKKSLDRLLKEAGSKVAEIQLQAIIDLAEHGPKAAPALPHLLKAM